MPPADPKVKRIKHDSIYRLAKDSRLISSLLDATNNNKKVTVFMELKARFDEAANIEWAKILTDAGVKVEFGVPTLKVHSKLCLIERQENKKDGLLRPHRHRQLPRKHRPGLHRFLLVHRRPGRRQGSRQGVRQPPAHVQTAQLPAPDRITPGHPATDQAADQQRNQKRQARKKGRNLPQIQQPDR